MSSLFVSHCLFVTHPLTKGLEILDRKTNWSLFFPEVFEVKTNRPIEVFDGDCGTPLTETIILAAL